MTHFSRDFLSAGGSGGNGGGAGARKTVSQGTEDGPETNKVKGTREQAQEHMSDTGRGGPRAKAAKPPSEALPSTGENGHPAACTDKNFW